MINLDKKFWLAAACSASLGISLASNSVMAGAILKYGDTYLGVNNEGQLNVRPSDEGILIPAGFVPPVTGSEFFGTEPSDIVFGLYRNGVGDSTSPGCACEGWGVAATLNSGAGERIAGGANEDDGGAFGISGGEFGSTSSTATSTVYLDGTNGGTFDEGGEGGELPRPEVAVASFLAPVPNDTLVTVTHAFGPSLAEGVFQVSVSIKNNTDSAIDDLVYRRAMDWDIPPTEFAEFVTHGGVEANLESAGGNVRYASDNGFATWDPREDAGAENSETVNVDFTDNGPDDHGSVFDFAFGELEAGDSRTFNIFYGSTANEVDALNAISLLGADVYSLGQQSGSAEDGEPATFLFAFGGVGGVEPGDSADVPVLPFVTAPGEFVFTSPEPRLWFDPPYADGFSYELAGGAFFTSVTLPSALLGFGTVDVVVDGLVIATLTSDDGVALGMDTFAFGAGVDKFSLVGLDMLLDIADPSISTAFPVFLDWAGTATELFMVALEAKDSGSTDVPEPAPLVVLLSGLTLLFLRRNKINR
jgi:hypothetical protein